MKLWKKDNDFLLLPDGVASPDGYARAETPPIASEAIKYTYHLQDRPSSRYEILRLMLGLADDGKPIGAKKRYKRDAERHKLLVQRDRLLDRARWMEKQLRFTPIPELKKRLVRAQEQLAKVEAQLWGL